MENNQIYLMEPNSGAVDTKKNCLADMDNWEDDENPLSAEEQFDSLIEVAKTLDGDWIEYSYFDMSESQIEKELTAEDSNIRIICAMRTDYTPTLMQIERGLTDDDDDFRYNNVGYRIRQAFAERVDIVLTEAQIERGLASGHWVFKENEFAMRSRLERQKLGLEIKATIPNLLQHKEKVMAL